MKKKGEVVEYLSKLPSPVPPSFIPRPPVFSYRPCLEWGHLIANVSPLFLSDWLLREIFVGAPLLGSEASVTPAASRALYN